MTLSLYLAWITLVCAYECIHEVGHDTLYIPAPPPPLC